MPSFRHHDLGNMYVQFEVEFPEHVQPMDFEQKSMLKSILGLPATMPPPNKNPPSYDKANMEIDEPADVQEMDPLSQSLPADAMEDDVDLEEIDHSQQRRAHGATAMDEDEDGVPQGAERVQCASQ
jgi:DnaJ family protein A protein 2